MSRYCTTCGRDYEYCDCSAIDHQAASIAESLSAIQGLLERIAVALETRGNQEEAG